MSAHVRRFAALGLGLVLALLGTEVAFRVMAPAPPQLRDESGELILSAPGAVERYERESNEQGFHDYAWTREKAPGTWRIVVLGDSFTAGRQLTRDELFTEILERRLNERSDEGSAYELFNVAKPGWGTANQLDALEVLVADGWAPDVALIVYFVNDASNMGTNPALVGAMLELFERRNRFLNRHWRSWDWLDLRLRRRRVSELTLTEYRDAFDSDREEGTWRESQEALLGIRDLAEEHGFRVGLVVFPVLMQLDEDHALRGLYDMIEERAVELGFPSRQLLPAFLGENAQDLWVLPTNAHPNARGNAIAARAIEAFLTEEGLLP